MDPTKLLAQVYKYHAREALEPLVDRDYSSLPSSVRLRSYLGRHEELKKFERQYPEYENIFTEIRREYTLQALIAVHNIVDKTIREIAGPRALSVKDILSIKDPELEELVGNVRGELGPILLAA